MAANVLMSTTLAEELSMSPTNGHVLISRSISPSILYPEIERGGETEKVKGLIYKIVRLVLSTNPA